MDVSASLVDVPPTVCDLLRGDDDGGLVDRSRRRIIAHRLDEDRGQGQFWAAMQ